MTNYLKSLMEQANIDTAALTRSLKGIVPRQTIHKILRGETRAITPELAEKLAKPLRIHPYQILQCAPGSLDFKHPRITPIDDAGYVFQMSNGDFVGAGQTFEIFWSIYNPGSQDVLHCKLICLDALHGIRIQQASSSLEIPNYLVPFEREIDVGTIASEEHVKIRARFNAPTYPGDYMSYWRLTDADGNEVIKGIRDIWCRIQVVELIENRLDE